MSGEISRYGQGNLPALGGMSRTPWQRRGQTKALDKIDDEAELQARRDFNAARLQEHRLALEAVLDKQKNQADIEVAEDMMVWSKSLHTFVSTLTNDDPGLELHLRGIQTALHMGFEHRMMRRSMGM